jgi:hypothetical protein
MFLYDLIVVVSVRKTELEVEWGKGSFRKMLDG